MKNETKNTPLIWNGEQINSKVSKKLTEEELDMVWVALRPYLKVKKGYWVGKASMRNADNPIDNAIESVNGVFAKLYGYEEVE